MFLGAILKVKLSYKIALLVALPFGAYVFSSFQQLQQSWKESDSAIEVRTESQYFKLISRLIHEVQKERAKTALFLSGDASSSDLAEQRSLTDEVLKPFQEESGSRAEDNFGVLEATQAVEEKLKSLLEVRALVDAKSDKATWILGQFTSTVASLLQLELSLTKAGRLGDAQQAFISLSVVETAKENMGRLRATGIKAIGDDKPITEKEVELLQTLKSGIDFNFNSPSLMLTQSSEGLMKELKESREWANANSAVRQIMSRASTGHFGLSAQTFFSEITASIDRVAKIVDAELTAIEALTEWQLETARGAFLRTIVTLSILTLILLILSYFVIRAITRPVEGAVVSLKGTSVEVKNAATELEKASDQLATSTTQAASSMEETVASLEELTSMVNLNAENAKKAAEISEMSRQAATQGHKEIGELIEAMTDISSSSRKIEEIINVIEDIAFQTNLLALNAAVEAARAGEHGKGFAVVSDAVRNLAQRSGTAAKEISSLIRESVSKTEHGSQVAGESGKVLQKILEFVNSVADLNLQIAEASKEQASGISQISKAMNELDQFTQSNAASAEEVTSFSKNMLVEAASLQDLSGQLAAVVDGAATNKAAIALKEVSAPAN